MKQLVILVLIFLTPEYVSAQSTISLDGYNNLLGIELKGGALSFFETSNASNFAISIESNFAALCKSEIVSDPTRVLIDCPGKILVGLKPLSFTNSKMAKKVRFGYSGDSSKIVVDMIVDVLAVQSSQGSGGQKIFVFGGKGKDWSTPTPVATIITNVKDAPAIVATASPSATPLRATEEFMKNAKETGPVFTPVPLPKIEYGETELRSITFGVSAELNSPTVKIGLGAGRKVELKRQSANRYVLKIDAARVYSPIFLNPQNAPDGVAPFKQVTVSEVSTKGGAFSLSAQIDLSEPAELQVRQTAGDIEIYLGTGDAGEEQ